MESQKSQKINISKFWKKCYFQGGHFDEENRKNFPYI